jgi:hypothetical protein
MKRFSALSRNHGFWIFAAAVLASLMVVPGALAYNPDALVTHVSPTSPFSQNKQNEPAVAIDPSNPDVVAAGANDEIDMEACNAGDDTTCPFTTGVGVSGVYFSFNRATSWIQPTYTGWTARFCLGIVGNTDPPCAPEVGPIGTLPNYFENGLVSDGDPAVAFGPRPGAGGFSWSNGSRLYYANLTANFSAFRSEQAFKGFEAIAVSRTDDVQAAAAGDQSAWMDPVIVSKQNAALFSDHEMISVDDAESSPFFGNVYVCDAAFRSQEISPFSLPEPIELNSSSDGGNTWTHRQVSRAVNNIVIGGRQDCQVDTDSNGVVYVFWDGATTQGQLAIFYIRSFDGGKSFERPARVLTTLEPTESPFDGAAGARDGVTPSISIANGAPTGANAPNTIAVTYAEGPTPTDENPGPFEKAQVWLGQANGRAPIDWHGPFRASPPTDRPMFPALALSPDGSDLYLTYDAFLQPWQSSVLAPPRLFQGVNMHADVPSNLGSLSFTELSRAPIGDARGSSANALTDEFLGDYNFAFATNEYGVTVWNDGRDAANCPAIDAYRQSIVDGSPIARPAPEQDCDAQFGNTDIYSGSFADLTP